MVPLPSLPVSFSFTHRGIFAFLVFVIGILYLFSVLVLSIVGASGPQVFNESYTDLKTWHVDNNVTDVDDDGVLPEVLSWTKTFALGDLRSEEQLIYLKLQLRRLTPDMKDQEVTIISTVNVYGVDTADDSEHQVTTNDKTFQTVTWTGTNVMSEPFSLWAVPSIDYEKYSVQINLVPGDNQYRDYILSDNSILVEPDMVYVHTDFTQWSMGWKITFQILTILAMFSPLTMFDGLFAGFFVQMRNLPWRQWSDMQVWIACLLVGLFFFNDPFFPFEVFSDSQDTTVGLISCYIILLGGFLSMVLCFFLCTSEDISSEGMSQYLERKGAAYYVPKTILCGALWILLTCFYAIARLSNSGSPKYDQLDDNGTYYALEIVLGIFMGIWAAWFLVHMVKSLGRICSASLPYAFLFLITAFSATLMIVGILTGALYPLPDSSFRFLFFYGNFNLYVWVLAFAYAPEKSEDDGSTRELQDNNGLYDQLNPNDNHGMI